jgi:isoleucyl-tRNA synthetase
VARLSAPFIPFITDEIFTNLTGPVDGPDSVHLADWPAPDSARRDDTLRRRMALVRKLVALGRSARTDAKVRVRQPLSRALVVLPQAEVTDLQGLEDVMSEELNVRSIEIASGLEDLVSYTIKPNFKALGPRFGAQVKDVAAALAAVDAHSFVSHLEDAGGAEIEVGGNRVGLTRDEVDVRVEGREGFSIAQDSHYGVALDIELTDELIAEGTARETVRGVQDLRKASGLAVEDRIQLWLATDDVTRSMLEPHAEFIANETLASEVAFEAAADGVPSADVEVEGRTITVALQRG